MSCRAVIADWDSGAGRAALYRTVTRGEPEGEYGAGGVIVSTTGLRLAAVGRVRIRRRAGVLLNTPLWLCGGSGRA
jgi:hypothetical protein